MPYLQRGDARIWWEAAGTGPSVLLIMGLGYPADMWYRVLPALAPRYRTIRFDNRGVGRTGVPPGPYSIEQMAADAASVLGAAGTARAHVVGVSLGGIIAQELAISFPDLTQSLVLISTHPGGGDAVELAPEAMQLLTARSSLSPRDAAEAAIDFVYAPQTSRSLIEEDIAVRMRQPTDPAGYTYQLQAAVDYRGAYSRLDRIHVPTLVVHGSADRLVPPANAPLLARAIPDAEQVILDGASHILATDRTDELNALLLRFLDSHSGSVAEP